MMKKRVFCIFTILFCLVAGLAVTGPGIVQASSIDFRVTCAVEETCYKGVNLKGSISSLVRVSEIGFEYQIDGQGSWYPVKVALIAGKFTKLLYLESYDTNIWRFRAYCIRGGRTYYSEPTPLTTLPADPPRFLFIQREAHATWALVDLTIYPNNSRLLTVGYDLSIVVGPAVRRVNVVTTNVSAITTLHLEITDLEPNTNYNIKGIYTNMLPGTRYGNSAGFSTSSSDDPTPMPVPTVTPRPSPTPTVTPRPSLTPTVTPRPSPTPTVTPIPTATPTISPSPSPSPISSPTPAQTETESAQPSAEPTVVPSHVSSETADPAQDTEPADQETSLPESESADDQAPAGGFLQSGWLIILILGLAAAGIAAVAASLVIAKRKNKH